MKANEIKEQYRLLKWIEDDLGISGKGPGSTKMFQCPYHDDTNPSLAVYIEENRWYCFGCKAKGDIFSWRKRREGLSFRDCMADFAGRLGTTSLKKASNPKSTTTCRRQPQTPELDWQEMALQVVDECHRLLLSGKGSQARQWLHIRGISDITIQKWRLGFLPAGKAYSGYKDNRSGITIPWLDGRNIWKLNVRRGVTENERPKYRHFKGSKASLFGTQMMTGKPNCFITEGELDAILLWQEVHDFADVLSLGGATNRLANRWLIALLQIEHFWIVTDNDAAGDIAANYWMDLVGERGQRLELPDGIKDVTEYWQAGASLENWAAKISS